MTINPVDMQVLIPQTGQANRVQRGLQQQLQTEQQILGQMNTHEIKNKENTVIKSEQALYKKIRDENKQGQKDRQKENSKQDKHQEKVLQEEKGKGSQLDIKV